MNYYTERLEEHGPTVQALGWGNEGSQRIRFKLLCEIGDLRATQVLDFGCGFGDLYGYLQSQYGGWVKYTGCDREPEMRRQARLKYPNGLFLDHPVVADWVLASGVFNLPKDWQFEVSALWGLCRQGIAVNFTSSLAVTQTPGIVYADPFDTARFFSTLTNKFTLRHDYKPNDFTIYGYK